ncbi:MAG: hypothetical protein MHPSP_002798, partial [Paramarteilia canceri]
TKVDQLLSELDVDKMLGEVQTAMQPLQNKIVDMSQSFFARVELLNQRITELEEKKSKAFNTDGLSGQD